MAIIKRTEKGSALTHEELDGNFTDLEGIRGGKAGGQTVTGGTASGEDLTLSSTSHAVKGQIKVGAVTSFDETNGGVLGGAPFHVNSSGIFCFIDKNKFNAPVRTVRSTGGFNVVAYWGAGESQFDNRVSVHPAGIDLSGSSGYIKGWSGNLGNTSIDIGLRREAAGVWAITDGNSNTAYRDLKLRSITAVSTTQGSTPFPLMTEAQRLAIASPGVGSHVYQTDAGTNGEGVYVYKSTGWVKAY